MIRFRFVPTLPEMRFQIVLEPSDEGGFTAIARSLPGCISEGRNREEALKNIQQAIELYLEPLDEDSDFPAEAEFVEISV